MSTVQDHRNHQPWCTDQHPDDTDTQCRSDYEVVQDAVVLHDADTVPGGTAYVTDDVLVALEACVPGGPARVLLNAGDTYMAFTLEGARQLAAVLIARANAAEAVST
jgi:hypothetical protein